MNDLGKNIILWLVIAMVLLTVFERLTPQSGRQSEISYSDFRERLLNGQVDSVVVYDGQRITGKLKSGEEFETRSVEYDNAALIGEMDEQNVIYSRAESEKQSILFQLFLQFLPVLLLIGVWLYFMRQMQGGGGGRSPMQFGKSKARMLTEDQVNVNFNDVAGVEEAKQEVGEIVDFLKDPSKFQRLGGKIPRGVLMVGPPGTGKTLLARAIAGEAKVPFFTISGSDFVEMFVGVGASRVRDMFADAKKHAPCIIFIDEIDAVGRHRGPGGGYGGGHDEREQTLNQLLVEMDGFEGNEGIIVIAATNRPDVLDKALLRPGRFDRQVVVPLPDVRGRELILKVHMRKVPVDDDVQPQIIARGTPGFSGADLANLVNEAALFAARANKRTVTMDDFEMAKDKIMMGAERRSMVMTEEEKLVTAYHEAGHAIVGLNVPEHDPVYKVTIIPRGRALGVTMFLPEEDRLSLSKQHLESNISTLYGGRIAEALIFGEERVTTGASNDIERASEIARNMVSKWGLSDEMGPLAYTKDDAMYGDQITIAGQTRQKLDSEVRTLIDDNYKRAQRILEGHMDELHLMAKALIKYETIDDKQIAQIMKGEEPDPPEDWNNSDTPPSSPPPPSPTASDKPLGGPAGAP
ncbi:MAG: ATP-dependent zinc metalloprotease FtsH [Pseudomonadota bacterium]